MNGAFVKWVIWVVLLPLTTLGQELMPNGGFETFANCPYKQNLLFEATPWYSPNQATPDFFHACGPLSLMDTKPRTGQGLATLFMDLGFAEYLATPLKEPLQAGEAYQFEFWVASDKPRAYPVSSFGAYFSKEPLITTRKDLLTLTERPQYLDNSPQRLTQRYQWENAGSCFVAKGGEKYVTIGNFVELPQLLGYYYLFIDDITLLPIKLNLGRDTTLCGRQTTKLLNAKTPGATRYQWSDGSSEPTLLVKKPGKYSVIVSTPCKTLRDTITIDYRLSFNLGQDTTLCDGAMHSLSVAQPGIYRWQDGSRQTRFEVRRPGIYTLQITDGNCVGRDTINIRYVPAPRLELGPDKELCGAEQYTINPTYAEGRFQWLDAFNAVQRPVTESDVYRASVTNDCAVLTDSIVVDYNACGCTLYAPDAFSPNNDGQNDSFGLIACGDITLTSLAIYNRWGQLIFQTTTAPFRWDGTHEGTSCPPEVYIWKASYSLRRLRKPPIMQTARSRFLLVQ